MEHLTCSAQTQYKFCDDSKPFIHQLIAVFVKCLDAVDGRKD